MEKGELRREMMAVFFTRVVDTDPGFSISENALADHFDRISTREALAFNDVQLAALQTIFPDCLIRSMTDKEHFSHYYRFLNPNVGAAVPEWVFNGYDNSVSMRENC